MELFEKVARDYLKRNCYGLQLHGIEKEIDETITQQSLSGSDYKSSSPKSCPKCGKSDNYYSNYCKKQVCNLCEKMWGMIEKYRSEVSRITNRIKDLTEEKDELDKYYKEALKGTDKNDSNDNSSDNSSDIYQT